MTRKTKATIGTITALVIVIATTIVKMNGCEQGGDTPIPVTMEDPQAIESLKAKTDALAARMTLTDAVVEDRFKAQDKAISAVLEVVNELRQEHDLPQVLPDELVLPELREESRERYSVEVPAIDGES